MPTASSASQQADALMLLSLLSTEELVKIFKPLGYLLATNDLGRTVACDMVCSSHRS